MRVKIFRWNAISVLVLVLGLLAIVWMLFADILLEQTTEEAGTQLLGTQVDLGSFALHTAQASVDVGRLEIADPFDLRRNLVEADRIRLKLNPVALAEKKLVIEQFSLSGMRFGAERSRPAAPAPRGGFASQMLTQVKQWGDQFDVPLLKLTPIDTIRQLALDPGQLSTVREAKVLLARADSSEQAIRAGLDGLAVGPTVDSARALATRLASTDPAKLGLDGTRQAVASVRQTLKQIDDTKQRITALEQNATQALASLRDGLGAVDEARRRDYAFAKGLLKLPSLDAPEIGGALFGTVSLHRFQQALYWTELARKYMPPGLLPRTTPGSRRLRRAGQNVHFPKEQTYPAFLLRTGEIDFALGGKSPLAGAYAATVRGLTSEPALYGRPMTITGSRSAQGTGLDFLRVDGLLDHTTPQLRDSLTVLGRGLSLPGFDLPGLPFRVEPGKGSSSLAFALHGTDLNASWSVASDQVAWSRDSAPSLDPMQQTVWRVVSGLNTLTLTAQLTGTISSPRLSVRSNLDEAVAARLKALLGEEIAKAEARVRVEVDRVVNQQVEPIKRQVTETRAQLEAQVDQRLGSQRKQLDEVRQQLEAQLKRLAAPGGLIKLPKLKL